MFNVRSAKGIVYLVGAGVGKEEYLTVKARDLLKIAEVVIYDALVDEALLNLTDRNCLKLAVGKRGGKTSTPQKEIDRLLVKYCQEGKLVVRLKSGDPFIFGRANEEINALRKANCNYQLVPGISSALAAPLLADIPLTDKHLSRCFTVLSGHQPEQLDWSALAKIDTLVILMGGRSLNTIIQLLIEYGRSPEESIAIIRNCGRSDREIFRGTLTDIVEKTTGKHLSPAVIVIGKVVQLTPDSQAKSNDLPLIGKTILVTRAESQSSKFTTMLQQQGATVVEMPALTIAPPSSWSDLDRAIATLTTFDWLILTSANGVNYFCDRLNDLGYDLRALGGVKIAVVGRKTASVLNKRGLKPDFIPPDYIADSLVANFPGNLTGQKILFPRVESGGREILVQELNHQEAKVIEVAAYQSKCPANIDEFAWQALQQQQIDAITFASSKTVRNFYQLLEQKLQSPDAVKSLLKNLCIASIGPQTSQTCQELFGRYDLEAQEYTLEGLTAAIIEMTQ